MSDISKINPNGTEYNLKDATARAGIESSKTIKSSVVTVTDAAPINAEDITVDITPQQDLHGYDRPWAGGAGKNKLPMTVAGIKAANPSFTWSGNTGTYGNVSFTLLTNKGNNVIGIKVYSQNASANVNLRLTATGDLGLNGLTLSGASGGVSVLAFDDTQSAGSSSVIPNNFHNYRIFLSSGTGIKDVTIYPMVSAEGGAFAPYSNICPIEGRTGAELDRDGANLWNNSDTEYGYLNDQGVVQPYQGFESLNYREISPGKPYTLSFYRYASVSDAGMRIAWYDADKQFIRRDGILETGTGIKTTTATAPNNAKYARASICITNARDIKFYQGEQYTASFGETVYGGKWHVTEGGTDKTHANIANYNGETINEPWLSSMDEYVAGATPTTGAQVVYPLTTPTTISTPKQNVPMLQGINTVYADCGDVSLKYQPDNVIGELKGEIQVANSFVAKMALRQGSGAKDFSYGGWSFRIRIFRSMGQISLYVENISASNVTEQAIVKVFMDTSDYRAPEELRPRVNIMQAATYTTPSGWAIQVYLKDDGYIMFTGVAPEVGASAPTSSNWNLVEPWAAHQQAKDLFNN